MDSTDKRYIVNVQGVVYRDDQYLLGIRSQREAFMPGILTIPGGKIEAEDEDGGDVLRLTVVREVLEEVNVTCAVERFVTSNYFVADGIPVMGLIFLCRYISGEARAVDPDEISAVHWMTLDQALAHENCMPWTAHYLRASDTVRRSLTG